MMASKVNFTRSQSQPFVCIILINVRVYTSEFRFYVTADSDRISVRSRYENRRKRVDCGNSNLHKVYGSVMLHNRAGDGFARLTTSAKHSDTSKKQPNCFTQRHHLALTSCCDSGLLITIRSEPAAKNWSN